MLKLISTKYYMRKLKRNIILSKRLLGTELSEPWMPIKYLTQSEQKAIENKWKNAVRNVPEGNQGKNLRLGKKMKYILSMFPYPSGKLHLGHVRVYTLSDAVAQVYRMKGWEVIHPMGWDAFGLPAENAAVDRGENPEEWTMKNIAHMKKQLVDLGCRFDWSREFATCNPEYYKWTQYIFLKLFEARLAYRQEAIVNWDPVDKTVLASEQVDQNGCSWRSGAKVERKKLLQWFIKATRFSKDLFEGLSDPSLENWKDIAKIQRNWIGECNGYTIEMEVVDKSLQKMAHFSHLSVWMAKPEHLESVTFLAIKSDHLFNEDKNKDHIIHNLILLKIRAVNPISKRLIPIIVSDDVPYEDGQDIYVGIPKLNEEDKNMAKNCGFDVPSSPISPEQSDIVCHLQLLNRGGYISSVNLKDWLISRQRYWGTPIPIIYCDDCGTIPVPEEDLPVKLPKIGGFIGKGTAALERCEEWLKCCCPRCGKTARRETDTMDTFVDSSWYFLRYLDPNNSQELIHKNTARMFLPVDLYIGGKEHALLHLYYARFMNKFLASIGAVSQSEPFARLLVQGMVKGRSFQVQETGKYLRPDEVDFTVKPPVEADGGRPLVIRFEKMSKSKYNGVDPQSLIEEYGVDAVRLAMLSNASPQSEKLWDSEDVKQSFAIMERLWIIARQFVITRRDGAAHIRTCTEEERNVHEAILFDDRNSYVAGVLVLMDAEGEYHFHTLIKFVQRMIKSLAKVPKNLIFSDEYEKSLRCTFLLLSPICPHLTAELWYRCNEVFKLKEPNQNANVFEQCWPSVEPSYKKVLKIWIDKRKRPQTLRIPPHEYSELTEDKALQMACELDGKLRQSCIVKTEFKYRTYQAVLHIKTNEMR